MYLAVYGKVIQNNDGVALDGIYIGGIAQDKDDADKKAKECINNATTGSTIIPKVYQLEQLDATIKKITKYYEDTISRMDEAYKILQRNKKIRRRQV